LPRRVYATTVAALIVAGLALFALRPTTGVPDGAPTEDEMATSIGSDVMDHLYRGHVAGRSGEIMTVPKPHRYIIGEWDLETLWTDEPTTTSSHPNPWNYTAHVPLVFYGPRYVPAHREVRDSVDVADIAPTYAALLGMKEFRADGRALPEVVSQSAGKSPPKAIVTVVLDGGGWNVLQQHPERWPAIAQLQRQGTNYVNATIGSAPSITGAIHATMGTGFYPRAHKVPGNQMRGPDGRNTDVWKQNADPRHLEKPTVSELWDRANQNRPWVGTVSYEGWHLGMIGHGAALDGGDRDVAVLWDSDANKWWINTDYYRLPSYLQATDLDTLASYERGLDERDGIADGTWFGHDLAELQTNTVRPGTPAFVTFTGDAALDVLRREPIGDDRLTDLFWIEMKMPDFAGHLWNMLRPEEGDVLYETDRQVARIKAQLDRSVGRRNYVLAITADHGQQPFPELYGGWRINSNELESDVEDRFGGDIVEKITTVDVFVDLAEVERSGVALSDVARYLATYTIGDNIRDGQPGADRVPRDSLDDKLFAGAFSTGYLQGLTPERIRSLGRGKYRQGDLGLQDVGS
jgi:hypothetical protein